MDDAGMTYEQAINALFETGAKAVLRDYFNENSCINSTRVVLEVFRTLRLEASPFAVRTRIYSKGFMEKAEREGGFPRTEEQVHEWTSQPGVWSVGIGYFHLGLPPDAWLGHLVLRAGPHLLDATISQASRPEKGLVLPEMLVVENVPADFWRGLVNITTVNANGSTVQYEPQPRNQGYMATPGWSFRGGIEAAAHQEIMGLFARANGRLGTLVNAGWLTGAFDPVRETRRP